MIFVFLCLAYFTYPAKLGPSSRKFSSLHKESRHQHLLVKGVLCDKSGKLWVRTSGRGNEVSEISISCGGRLSRLVRPGSSIRGKWLLSPLVGSGHRGGALSTQGYCTCSQAFTAAHHGPTELYPLAPAGSAFAAAQRWQWARQMTVSSHLAVQKTSSHPSMLSWVSCKILR